MAETQTEMARRAEAVERESPEDLGEIEHRSATSLVRELVLESSALMHAEVALIRTELKENLTSLQRGVSSAAAGAAVLAAGLLALLAAAILALALLLPAWLAALVIGGGVALVGAILVVVGLSRARPKAVKPTRAIESLKQTREISPREGQARERVQ